MRPAFILSASVVLFAAASIIGAAERLNVLLIMTDQQSCDAMSAAGNPHLKTPAMDSLAARGVRFEKSYCTYPLCSPSRASIETSRMPHELNIFNNNRAIIPNNVPTMGELFRNGGYRTAWAGKWHVPVPYPGFDEGKLEPRGFDVLPLEGPRHRSNPNVGPATGSDPATVKAAVKFLGEPQPDPFLLTVSLLNPHDICDYPNSPQHYPKPGHDDVLPPLPANFKAVENEPSSLQAGRTRRLKPGGEFGAYDERAWRTYRWVYHRLVERVDAHVATVLEALEKSRHAKNTVIVFTSDHGEMCGAHQLALKSQMYEEAARVPLILCVPGTTDGGRVDRTNLVCGLDILPTICDYAGINTPSSLQGRSLRAIVEHDGAKWRDHVIVELGDKELVRMVRSERYKYIVYAAGSNRQMLFDLHVDPHETRNLADDPAMQPVIDAHRDLLAAWIAQTNDKFILPPRASAGSSGEDARSSME